MAYVCGMGPFSEKSTAPLIGEGDCEPWVSTSGLVYASACDRFAGVCSPHMNHQYVVCAKPHQTLELLTTITTMMCNLFRYICIVWPYYLLGMRVLVERVRLPLRALYLSKQRARPQLCSFSVMSADPRFECKRLPVLLLLGIVFCTSGHMRPRLQCAFRLAPMCLARIIFTHRRTPPSVVRVDARGMVAS